MDAAAKREAAPGWIAGGIAILVFCFFAPTIGYDFLHSDDDVNVFENVHIQSLNWESLKWMFTDFEQAIRFKPLSWLGWAVIYQFSGLNPVGYHFANVLLHAINAALLFLVLLKLFEGDANRVWMGAAVATLLWSLHPLRVEPVAWVTGFPYHLTTAFLLLSVLAYLRVAQEETAFRQGWFWCSVGLYVLAIATYPIALGFVCVLLAIDAVRLRGVALVLSKETSRLVLEKIPFMIVAVGVAAITVMSRYRVESAWGSASTVEEYDYVRHVMQAGYVWIYYLWKPIFAFHQTAIPMDLIENGTFGLPFILSVIALFAISVGCLFKVRDRVGLIAFWTAHVGLLVPLLGLTEDYHFPSDRYAMLPSLVMAGGLFLLLAKVADQKRLVMIGGVAVLIFAVQSVRYLPVWEDDLTYFGYLRPRLEENIMRPAICERLGDAHVRREQFDEAILSYQAAIDGDSPFAAPGTYLKLATILDAVERFEGIEDVLARGLARQRNAGSYFLLAKSLIRKGERELAIQMLRAALAMRPDFEEARVLMGSLSSQ